MSEPIAEFEREKWEVEYGLRKREVEIKERDAKRSRWSNNSLAIVVFVAGVGFFGNAWVTWFSSQQSRTLEDRKAEAARVLEIIKTGDPEKAAVNLKFLLDAGLISDPDQRKQLQAFLDKTPPGRGPALPLAPVTNLTATVGP
jgi:hypothetical protein